MERQPALLSANTVFSTLLLKDEKQSGPLRFAHSPDGLTLQAFSRELAADRKKADRMLFMTGTGLDAHRIPVRFPALFVPVLRVMERCREIGIGSPRYLIYQATDFISEAINVDRDAAHATGERMRLFLSRYMETLHPQIADQVMLRFGNEVSLACEDVEGITAEIRERIGACTLDEGVTRRLEEYRRNNHAPPGSEYPYAAANVLCNGVVPSKFPFQSELRSDTEVLLPVGGRREEPFFQLSKAFRNGSVELPHVVPMLTRTGEMPTYYPYKAGDILDPEECTEQTIKTLQASLRYDFEALASDGASPELLRTLYPRR
jgi:hypothetical protein